MTGNIPAIVNKRRSRTLAMLRAGWFGLLAVLLYRAFLRPWHRKWGATVDEVEETMPGDDDVAEPNYNTTRAITIDAPPEQVWPWLVQMGQGRGGMYTYDALENIAGLNMHSADRIIPEYQYLSVGNIIPLSPDGVGYTVTRIEPNRLLVLAVDDPQFRTTWVWSLHPLEGDRTRLVVRWRALYNIGMSLNGTTLQSLKKAPLPTVAGLSIAALIDPGQFIMERGMLLGIKARAEHRWQSTGQPQPEHVYAGVPGRAQEAAVEEAERVPVGV